MGLFKKEKESFENKYYFFETKEKSKSNDKDIKTVISKNKKLSFLDKIFFNSTTKNIELPKFSVFVEMLYDVIVNNKGKPGFGKADAIKIVGKKMNLKSLETLAIAYNNPIQAKTIISKAKDKHYSMFPEIIMEPSLEKTLKYIKIIRKYEGLYEQYRKSNNTFGTAISIYIFGFIMAMFQWLMMPYTLYTQQIVLPDEFIRKWTSKTELFFMLPYVAFNGIADIFIKILYGMELFVIYILPLFIFIYLFKSINNYLVEKNKRNLDKYWNEMNFMTLLEIKIIEMEMGDGKFKKTNYIYFLKNVVETSYKRNLINIEWLKDFNKLMFIFDAVGKIIQHKSLPNISELFYNTLSSILEAYRGFITGSVSNFNLKYIGDKFKSTYIIETEMLEKQIKGALAIWGTVGFIVMLLLNFAPAGAISQQQTILKTLIGQG